MSESTDLPCTLRCQKKIDLYCHETNKKGATFAAPWEETFSPIELVYDQLVVDAEGARD
jgi:hypothetical protein